MTDIGETAVVAGAVNGHLAMGLVLLRNGSKLGGAALIFFGLVLAVRLVAAVFRAL